MKTTAKPDQSSPVSPRTGRWVLAATILGSSMAFIDGSVVNVALPVLQTDLSATSVQVQWVVQAYTLFLSALILTGGSMGDHLGRKKVFLWGIITFALASVWCGLAPTVTQLILARAVQGVGGALLVPGSLAIISAAFEQAERGRAIGTWSGFTAITTAFGPVLGGWLVEFLSWRAVFFINIPLAIMVVMMTVWRVPESRDEEEGDSPLDWWGAVLATLGIGGVVFGLTEASRLSFTHLQAIGPLALGSLILLLFVWWESRAASPMMPLRVFRSRTFSGANLLTLFLYGALGGLLFFLPFNLIQVQGYGPTAAGAALLPFVLILAVLSRWAGGLVERYGSKRPLIIGPVLTAAGFALFAWPGVGGSYWATFFPATVVLGLGMAVSVAPLTTTVMNSVKTQQSGVASGINNAVSRMAGLLGIAIMGIFITYTFNAGLDARLAPLDLAPETKQAVDAQRENLAAAEIPANTDPATQAALEQAIDTAYVTGFRVIMFFAAGLALASAFSAWWLVG